MIVGFTGTRKGMTPQQAETVESLLIGLGASRFVHGDCIGADADAHAIARKLYVGVEIRPCAFLDLRAQCKGAIVTHPIDTPFRRNRAIVDGCDLLIACPWTAAWSDLKKGGTVYTIRYAVRTRRRTLVITPDGIAKGPDPDTVPAWHSER